MNSALGVAPTTADFVKEGRVERHDRDRDQQAGTGTRRRRREDVARQMIADHTKTSEELKTLVSDGVKAEIPPGLDDAHQKKVDKLKDAKTDDFTSDYASMQVSAHKEAVSLFELYAKGGEDPKLKDGGQKNAPAPAASS